MACRDHHQLLELDLAQGRAGQGEADKKKMTSIDEEKAEREAKKMKMTAKPTDNGKTSCPISPREPAQGGEGAPKAEPVTFLNFRIRTLPWGMSFAVIEISTVTTNTNPRRLPPPRPIFLQFHC
ncbi:hypothetical protein MLD38_013555 [Melastoma candidum]|uniref:Uncharacterized protein n=1 Tax=Melastoma candidum TaxID=119954 RepID=A0ACB9RE64_9MYRT|nr:hypothetical protein MLD38_013555 [Melastoma candidum]